MEEIYKLVIAVIGSLITYLFGYADTAFKALLIFITLDYLTGVISSWYRGKLKSSKGWKGIVKKVVTLSLVVVATQIELVFNSGDTTRSLVVFFLLANEALSILENLALMGVNIPRSLKVRLEQVVEKEELKK